MTMYLYWFFPFVLFLSPSQRLPAFPDPSPPAVAPDGRIAVAIDGDIWVVTFDADQSSESLQWEQLTQGPAQDRDPAWSADGSAIIFASDRSGNFDLWKIATGERPEQITNGPDDDTQPAVARDGSLLWIKGTGADADIWLRSDGQADRQVTTKLGSETQPRPALTDQGLTIAYIVDHDGQRQLRLFNMKDSTDVLIPTETSPEYPAWSPDGERLAYSTRGRRPGVWITDREGKYQQPISTRRAAAAWLPGGEELVLLGLPRSAPSYNGDPTPGKARPAYMQYDLFKLPAPLPPDEGSQALVLPDPADREGAFTARFAQVADFLTDKYSLAEDTTWLNLIEQQGKVVATAKEEEELEQAIYKLIRDRPLLRPEVRGRAAISSAHPLATAAGLEVLEKGGNVVDAAIAVSFALGVVEPDASGIGGYGEMLVYLRGMEAPACIEFLTRVPEAASLDNGTLSPLPDGGPVLVNIPGTVAGMELAWKRYGSKDLEWADLLAPAIRLAEQGFAIDEALATTLKREKEQYLKYTGSRDLLFRDSVPMSAGDTLRNPDLAWTLKQIATGGADAFYKGPIARRMVADLRGQGNVMTLSDMARYYAVERQAVRNTYRGHTIYSGPPPTVGGALLAGKLNLLEQLPDPQSALDDPLTLHSMIEAWKLAPSTAGRIADPGLWPVDLGPFTDKGLAYERWQSCFDPLQSITPQDTSCIDDRVSAVWGAEVLDDRRSTGTTAFAIADDDGNMVAVTQTLGTWGGNFYVTPGLGFLYNDKLRSYRSDPTRYNARIPFARNVTSIAPTMIFRQENEREEPYAALGAAGNAWITSAVYQIVTGMIDQGLGPQAALEQPRFLVGMRRDGAEIEEIVVQMEDGFAPGMLEALRSRGHDLHIISARGELRMGYASAVMVSEGEVRAGADPRRSGQAGAVK